MPMASRTSFGITVWPRSDTTDFILRTSKYDLLPLGMIAGSWLRLCLVDNRTGVDRNDDGALEVAAAEGGVFALGGEGFGLDGPLLRGVEEHDVGGSAGR